MMTREEAKEIFLRRGFIKADRGDSVFFDGNKWREACSVISEWLKEEPKEVDCVIRGDVKEMIENDFYSCWDESDYNDRLLTDLDELPSVAPQQPKSEWEQDHAILKAYSDGANDILDKIKVEIEQLPTYDRITDESYFAYEFKPYVLHVIDKYREESEDKE